MLRLLLVSLLVILPALPAAANVVRPLAAKPGVSELRSACSSAGGTFSVHADGGGYGCETKNCDGKGGTCIVACDNNNNCNGSTPARLVNPTTLIGILQNGKLVVRDPVTTGSTNSLSSPSTGAPAKTGSDAPPPIFLY